MRHWSEGANFKHVITTLYNLNGARLSQRQRWTRIDAQAIWVKRHLCRHGMLLLTVTSIREQQLH